MGARIFSLVLVMATVLFVILKQARVISWSWWWVLSPLWLGGAVVLVGAVLVIAVLGLMSEAER